MKRVALKKGHKVIYTSASGGRYSAFIKRAHRDGQFTVSLNFPIIDGEELQGAFQGDTWRVRPAMVREWAAQ